jgi:hypothetical protein
MFFPFRPHDVVMQEISEYFQVLRYLYGKSLILEDTSEFHPVLHFYFMDAIAHIDYTLGTLAFNFLSAKNEMAREYLRWRIDEEQKGDRAKFPGFINWLKTRDEDRYNRLPMMWRDIYDTDDPAGYRSFRIVLDPDSAAPIPARFFYDAIEELFDREFLRTLYRDASMARLFDEYAKIC